MIAQVKYCIVDVETGGLSPEKNPICEIAFVILDHNMQEVDRHSVIIKNYNDGVYAPQAMAVHGIKMAEIEAGVDIKDALQEIEKIWAKHCKGRQKVILVAHNMDFDYKMLKFAFEYCGMDIHAKTDIVMEDTLWMARKAWGHDDSMVNFKLGTCCERADIHMSDAHRALGDVLSTAKLFEHFTNLMRSKPTGGKASGAVSTLRKHVFKF